MPVNLILRVLILSLGLIVCLYSIQFLDTKGIEHTAFKHFLMLEQGQEGGKWNWCQGDIVSIQFLDQFHPKNSWQTSVKDMESSKLQKWLDQNCVVNISKYANLKDPLLYTHKLVIVFSEGRSLRFDIASKLGFFRWKNQVFKSENWLRVLKELSNQKRK